MKALIIALALITTACGYDDVTLEADHYEQMVCAHEATGQGWADYKHVQPDCESRREPNLWSNP